MAKSIVSPKTYLTYSLGCRTNQAEMESISLQLTANGLRQFNPFTLPPSHSPDLILLNTCVVTQKAERETRKEIRKLQRLYPKSSLAVLGCAVTAKQKFIINLPEADLLITNADKGRVIELLEQKYGSFPKRKQHPTIDNLYIRSGRKFIKIQEGCHLSCSFCQTAYLRGEPKSVPPTPLIKEVNFWLKKGIKEIILTGINIALYGLDLKEKVNITDLVKLILKETPAEKISFSSIYPEMLTQDFLGLIIKEPRISRCSHLCLQSGSRTVLKRMNRETALPETKKKLLFLKKKIPEFTFRADIIVGFPGETEKEFKETLDFIKKAKISFVHSFLFSVRPGTKAERMIKSGKWKEVPIAIKKKRAEILNKEIEKIRHNLAIEQLNNKTNCLIVRKITHGYEGITENGCPVLIKKQRDRDAKTQRLKGQIVPIRITEFKNDQLWGKFCLCQHSRGELPG